MEMGVAYSRGFDHGVADFDADAVGGGDGAEQFAGFAADFENAFVGLDDKLDGALEIVVEISVGANPLVAAGGDGLLVATASFTDMIKGRRSPILGCRNLRFVGDGSAHGRILSRRLSRRTLASFICGATCKAAL